MKPNKDNRDYLQSLNNQAKNETQIVSSLYKDLIDFYLNQIALNSKLNSTQQQQQNDYHHNHNEEDEDLWL